MGALSAAGRFLRGVRRGLSQFMRELAEDLQGPRPIAQAPPPPVSDTRRVAIVQTFQRDYEQRAHVLVDRLVEGDINLNTWLSSMAIEVRALHTSAAVAGVGGFGNLHPDDLQRIEVATQTQLAYLRAWGRQLATMDGDYSERQMKVRASLYGGASNATFSKAQIRSMGVPDLPYYPAENTECRTNCGCAWEIEPLDGDGNFDCHWRRGKTDSCKTCIARERRSPLQVRGGQIVQRPTGPDLYAARSVFGLVDVLYDAGRKAGRSHD